MNQPESPKYATLFYHIKHQLKIDWVEYVLLDMVYHLSYKTGYCYKTPLQMSVDLGVTKRGVNKMIARLKAKGLMERLTDNALRVTDAYTSIQYISGNKIPTKQKGGNLEAPSGNSVTQSGNSTTKQQRARITKNNKELGEGYKKAKAMRAKLTNQLTLSTKPVHKNI